MPLQIQTLISQHKAVLEIVQAIDALRPETDSARIAEQLGKFKTALIAHLDLEDRELYPALREAGDRPDASLSLKTNINQFFDEMEGIKAVVVGFLTKWTAPAIAADAAGFRGDFAGIVDALDGRISREEARLYPLYDKHVALPH